MCLLAHRHVLGRTGGLRGLLSRSTCGHRRGTQVLLGLCVRVAPHQQHPVHLVVIGIEPRLRGIALSGGMRCGAWRGCRGMHLRVVLMWCGSEGHCHILRLSSVLRYIASRICRAAFSAASSRVMPRRRHSFQTTIGMRATRVKPSLFGPVKLLASLLLASRMGLQSWLCVISGRPVSPSTTNSVDRRVVSFQVVKRVRSAMPHLLVVT